MKESGYGAGYRYPHDASGGVDPDHQSYLPDAIAHGPQGVPQYVCPARGWEATAHAALLAARGEDVDPTDDA